MVILDKFIHFVAIMLFLLEAGRLALTDAVPTTFSATIYCIAGAAWVASSYLESSRNKTE